MLTIILVHDKEVYPRRTALQFGKGSFSLPSYREKSPRQTRSLPPWSRSRALWHYGMATIEGLLCIRVSNNQLLNFVCIHPDTESHATKSDGEIHTAQAAYKFITANDGQSGTNRAA